MANSPVDLLSSLEADTIEAVQAAESRLGAVSAQTKLPAPDFTGSLDYIDSLASRRSLTVSKRDLAQITTAAMSTFDYLSPLVDSKAVLSPTDVGFRQSTDFRPLGDDRRYYPESVRPLRALSRSAIRVYDSPIRLSPKAAFPPGWRNPLDPDRSTEDLNRVMEEMERRLRRAGPFSRRRFGWRDQVVICLKRKIRRNVMAAMGHMGRSGFNPPRRTYWSKVVC